MKLFNKTKIKQDIPLRVTRMSTPDLTSWANLLTMQLGQTIDKWAYHSGAQSEVTEVLMALNQVWQELLDRNDD